MGQPDEQAERAYGYVGREAKSAVTFSTVTVAVSDASDATVNLDAVLQFEATLREKDDIIASQYGEIAELRRQLGLAVDAVGFWRSKVEPT